MGTKLHSVNIPHIEPLSEIERKSPRLINQLKYCEDSFAEVEKENPTIPTWVRLFTIIMEPFFSRYYQKYVDQSYNCFIRVRKVFHETLERHSDCYHQVLIYDRQISTDPKLYDCKKHLDELWDMFAYGDGYFNDQFMSYFGKYKLELDEAIAQMQ